MYDGRKVKIEFEYPLLDNYYSDWHQLSFYHDSSDIAVAVYEFEEDIFGGVHAQDMSFNLAKFRYEVKTDLDLDIFTKNFIEVWLHEFFHLVGLSDEGIKRVKSLGFPVA